MTDSSPLKILHVFRAPVGGLFRHVVDLVAGQAARGHQVGLIADATTGGVRADETLGKLASQLTLGITRFPMRRQISPSDIMAFRHVNERIASSAPDIIHGHGAKGAAYARLSALRNPATRVYTPHGGSLLFRTDTAEGLFYVTLEMIMRGRTDLFLFESAYSRKLYEQKVGIPRGIVRVVHNGVGPADFEPISPADDATDIIFIGELRPVKGVDILIEAIGMLHAKGLRLGAAIVGDGPDRPQLQEQAKRLNLAGHIRFHGPMPARQAFRLGRLMVVPSRAESLPYIVLEAAAGGMPLIVTDVGGVSEIFGSMSDRLIPSENAAALAQAIETAVGNLPVMREATMRLRDRVASDFSADGMVDGILAGYRDALKQRR